VFPYSNTTRETGGDFQATNAHVSMTYFSQIACIAISGILVRIPCPVRDGRVPEVHVVSTFGPLVEQDTN